MGLITTIASLQLDSGLSFIGRLHPLLLHLPIGSALLLAGAELWNRIRGRRLDLSTRRLFACLTALTAIASALSGWLLAEDLGSGEATFTWHKYLGIAFAAGSLLTALAALGPWERLYGWLLSLSCLLLIPAGHLGAEMVHGPDFLFAPFTDPAAPAREASPSPRASGPSAESSVAPPADDYTTRVAPLLASYCGRCHGARRQRGGLVLDDPELLLVAGASGAAPVVPGNAAASEIIRRMRLPLDDDEHMPPASKPQVAPEELELVVRWIESGAKRSSASSQVQVAAPAPSPAAPQPPAHLPLPSAEERQAAIAALRNEFVHVETIEPREELLWIDFRPRPASDDAFVTEHLKSLAPWVAEVSLGRTATGDAALAGIADLPRLEVLDLSWTNSSSSGLAPLVQLNTLRSLNLTGTPVDDSALGTLRSLATGSALRRLSIARTGLSAAGLNTLQADASELLIVGRPTSAAGPLEVEPPVRIGPSPALLAMNTLCPVTEEPIDPAFRIVHEGKVIGFCCAECLGRFWIAPADYPLKLSEADSED